MADKYVSTTGNDGNTGDTPGDAYRTISYAITACSTLVTANNKILLKGSVSSPETWDTEPDNEVNLEDYDNGTLAIQPECWAGDSTDDGGNGNYENGFDPFDSTAGEGVLDPTAAKPCKVKARIKANGAVGVTIKGIELLTYDDAEQGISIEGTSEISFKYCAVNGFTTGVTLVQNSI